MANLKSGVFATWLKSCLAKKKMAISPMALNHLSENQESPWTLLRKSDFVAQELYACIQRFLLPD